MWFDRASRLDRKLYFTDYVARAMWLFGAIGREKGDDLVTSEFGVSAGLEILIFLRGVKAEVLCPECVLLRGVVLTIYVVWLLTASWLPFGLPCSIVHIHMAC